jgi:hypothetical protein
MRTPQAFLSFCIVSEWRRSRERGIFHRMHFEKPREHRPGLGNSPHLCFARESRHTVGIGSEFSGKNLDRRAVLICRMSGVPILSSMVAERVAHYTTIAKNVEFDTLSRTCIVNRQRPLLRSDPVVVGRRGCRPLMAFGPTINLGNGRERHITSSGARPNAPILWGMARDPSKEARSPKMHL